ncbi:MAG: 3-keto-5-aminohexanoate cleavage protein [Firmicutes bacterium]|nr:3-keto-5-aminohexanoate cleavage protein [Bacillota bacterium]
MHKIILTVAPVAAGAKEEIKNPLRPEEIAQEVIACAEEGASMVHLHVRDAEGKLTKDLSVFTRTLDLIEERTDIIIQGSTGGLSELSPEERCVVLNDPRVEVASLNMGSVNFDEDVYINTLPEIRYWAGQMRTRKVLPEMEIFEAGMVHNAFLLAEEGVLSPPFVFAFSLGFRGALPADHYSLFFLQGLVPQGSLWGLIHQGMRDMSLLAAAVGMGAAFIRVGFEDSIYLAPGRVANSNAELVAQAVRMIQAMGLEVATPAEARKILGLGSRCEL